MEAISQAGAAVGILAKDGLFLSLVVVVSCACSSFASPGVVLAAEKRISSKLIDVRSPTEKMYKIDDHLA